MDTILVKRACYFERDVHMYHLSKLRMYTINQSCSFELSDTLPKSIQIPRHASLFHPRDHGVKCHLSIATNFKFINMPKKKGRYVLMSFHREVLFIVGVVFLKGS